MTSTQTVTVETKHVIMAVIHDQTCEEGTTQNKSFMTTRHSLRVVAVWSQITCFVLCPLQVFGHGSLAIRTSVVSYRNNLKCARIGSFLAIKGLGSPV